MAKGQPRDAGCARGLAVKLFEQVNAHLARKGKACGQA